MNELIKIEHKGQRVLTTQQLAECYETDTKIISQNFLRNKSHYVFGIHYFLLEGQERQEFLNRPQIEEGLKHAAQIYLWTEKGALLHAKSLGTDKAWQVYEMLVDTYFRVKEMVIPQNLSPQLQVLINLELKQKELESQVAQQGQQIQTIKENIITRDSNFRKWCDDSIKKIAFARGNHAVNYADTRSESYDILEERAHCNLDDRLNRLRERMKESGATLTAVNNANKMDVIEADPKLREIYTAIIKEMLIKYVA